MVVYYCVCELEDKTVKMVLFTLLCAVQSESHKWFSVVYLCVCKFTSYF